MNKAKGPSKQFWTTDITTTLILLYENYPCLYNIQSRDYHNRDSRSKSIKEICYNLQQRFPQIQISEKMVQKKIHGIRTQYNSEINKIRKFEISGVSTDDIYQPKLWCFEMLSFLNDNCNIVSHGESTLNLDTSSISSKDNTESATEDEENSHEIIFEGRLEKLPEDILLQTSSTSKSSNTSTTTPVNGPLHYTIPQRRKRRSEQDGHFESLIHSATKALNDMHEIERTQEAEKENHIDAFTRYLKTEMVKIQDDELLDALKQAILVNLFDIKRKYNEPNI